jgi:hypothetical protein
MRKTTRYWAGPQGYYRLTARARNGPAKAQRRKDKDLRKGLSFFFAPLRLCGRKYPRLYACASLWQTLLNFSLVPVVIGSGQGFGRL